MGFFDKVESGISGFVDMEQAVGDLVGEGVTAVTGSKAAGDIIGKVISEGPGGLLVDGLASATGMNDTVKGAIKLGLGMLTLEAGGPATIAAGFHDLMNGAKGAPPPAGYAPPADHGAAPVPPSPTVHAASPLPDCHLDPASYRQAPAGANGTGGGVSPPPASTAGVGSSPSPNIDSILGDDSLSLEEKVSMVLASIEGSLKDGIEKDLKKLTDKDGKVDPKVQADLQNLMSAKSEMESIASNMSKSEHDIRSQIIGNMR
jgi:hypothetical protein